MDRVLAFACIIFLSSAVAAQNQLGESARDVTARNSKFVQTAQGYMPRSLADLVEASPIIVRGSYGPMLDHRIDPGEGRTAEQLAQQATLPRGPGGPPGLPVATYEFHVTELIKDSDLVEEGARSIEIEIGDSADALKVFPWLAAFRAGEHLLFLDVASNGVFYLRGPAFDMKREGDRYEFLDYENRSTAFGSDKAEAFVSELRELAD